MSATGRVLHLVPPNGGGVDRFVRDLCSLRPADWLLHVSDEQCVVECPGQNLFVPIAFADLRQLVAKSVLGRPAALHVHSTVRAVREATNILATGLELPWILTLHDVQFTGQADRLEPDELAQRLAFIRAAAHRTVPSRFIRDMAAAVLGESVACTIVENGVDRLPAATGAATGEQFPIAVIGAMGQHKGLAHLIDVAAQLPGGMRIALLGYADGQLGPGWLVADRIRVHGVFEPAELPRLVAECGATLAFFPKGQPESYCYALSDAWLAGLPAIGPDHGAIGERLRTHGGGMVYDVNASPADVARIIAGQLRQAGSSRADVCAAVQGLNSVAAMVETMNELYAAVAGPEQAPDLDALKLAAAKHLDSRFFRQELLRLQGDCAAAALQRDNALDELRALADNFDKRGAWIDQVQQSCDSLQQEADEQRRSMEELRLACASLRERLIALEQDHAALQETHQTLAREYATLVRRLTWPLRLLPAAWQAWLKKTVRHMLVGGEKNG